MIVHSVIVVRKTHAMVVMGQAIDGHWGRHKCHGYRRRDESKYGRSGHRNRDTEADASPEFRQHAATFVILTLNHSTGGAYLGQSLVGHIFFTLATWPSFSC